MLFQVERERPFSTSILLGDVLSYGVFFANNRNWTKKLSRVFILHLRVSSLVIELEGAGFKIFCKM